MYFLLTFDNSVKPSKTFIIGSKLSSPALLSRTAAAERFA